MRVTNEQAVSEIVINGFKVIIDGDNYEFVASHKWSVNKWALEHSGNTYFSTYIKELSGRNHTSTFLHRYIMGCSTGDGNHVDHINRNTLDNRRSNLRICNQSENNKNVGKRKNNKSGYKGVYWHKNRAKWRAQIKCDSSLFHIGYFLTKEEAAIAYNNKAIELHGEFALLNVIEKEQTE